MLLQQLYPGDAIASFVIRVLVEITLITVSAILFARLFGKQNPAFRHGVCVCALFCVFLAPISTLTLQSAGWQTFEISLDRADSVQPDLTEHTDSVVSRKVVMPGPFWTLERARSAASLTILVWAVGSAFLVFRLWSGSRKVNRLLESSQAIEHPNLDEAMGRLRQSQDFPKVPVRFARRLHSPVVVGPVNSTVILPEKLLSQLDVDQLRCVLAHELTHVRQRDPLVGLIQRIVEAAYWPHPFVHLLNRDLIRAREEVCDNVALHGTTAPYYASTLLKVALGISSKPTAPGMIGLMTPPWKLEERVKGLLDPRRRLTTTMNTRHLALMAIALVSGTVLIAGTRVVAAPVPMIPQETVKIVGQIDAKSHSVKYKTKTYKPADARSKHAIQVLTVSEAANNVTKESDGTSGRMKYKIQVVKQGSGKPSVHKPGDTFTIVTDDQDVVKSTTKMITLDAFESKDGKTVVKKVSSTVTDPFKGQSVTVNDGELPVKVQTQIETVTTSPKIEATIEPLTELHEKTDPAQQDKKNEVTYTITEDGTKKIAVIEADPHSVQKRIVLSGDVRLDPASNDKTVYRVFKPGEKVHVRYYKKDANVFQSVPTLSRDSVVNVTTAESPTTVYIKGEEIRIVGDQIRVVYVNAPAKAKAHIVKQGKLSIRKKN